MNPSYLLVLLGVVMVSYSGPLVKLALSFDATPVTVALMRVVLSSAILLPLMCIRRKGQSEGDASHRSFQADQVLIDWIDGLPAVRNVKSALKMVI